MPNVIGPEHVESAVRSLSDGQSRGRYAQYVKNEHREAGMLRPKRFGHLGSRSRKFDLSNDEPLTQRREITEQSGDRGTTGTIVPAGPGSRIEKVRSKQKQFVSHFLVLIPGSTVRNGNGL